MKLNVFTDLGLRALMRIASAPEQTHSTAEIAEEFGISRNHLTKAVSALSSAGFLVTRRGHDGGAQLAQPADTIRLGDVVRVLEQGAALVECFSPAGACKITADCRLKGFLGEAEQAFLASLDTRTLADCALAPRPSAEGAA